MAFLERNANRGSVSTGYDIDNSVKLQTAGVNSEFFNKSYSSAGNRETWTFSTWVKRTEIGSNNYLLDAYKNSNTWFILGFSDVDDIVLYDIISGTDYGKRTTAVYRDTSAWYHIVFVSDTTNGTAGDRQRLYVNGVRVTDFDSDYGDPPSGYDGSVNDAIVHSIGYRTDGNSSFNGYLAETILVDGTALDPTDFGEFDSATGIWKPIEITDTSFTWGTNGLWLKYDNAASMGANSAGTGGFSVQNVNQNDQATDTPTNNFCTWNPLWTFPIPRTISEGATNVDGSSAWGGVKGSIGVTNGKWYWENKASGNDTIIGWQTDNVTPPSGTNAHNIIDTVALYQDGNYVWIKDSTSGRNDTTASGTNASGQIMGFALDLDSSPQTATFYRNGSAIASDVNIDGATGKTLFPMMSQYNQNAETNFGGYTTFTISSAATDENGYGTFEYAPPSGYYALCSKNLAEYG